MTQSPAVQTGQTGDEGEQVLDIRPVRARWLDGWVAFAALTVPVFAVLYILTVPTGGWPPILLAHLVLVALFAAVELRLRNSRIRLTPTTIEERAYVQSEVRTPADQVAGVVLLDLYRGTSDGTNRQLFLVDAAGRTLLRMRGQLWDPAHLRAVATFYRVPITQAPVALTWKEARRSRFAGNFERWERHPRIVAGVVAVSGILLAVPVLAAITTVVDQGL
ncbi:MAG TPA: hypothetical protein VIL55_07490 [Naasia sp.]